MEESSLIRLDLRAPLHFAPAPDLEPFAYAAGESLFCFELDPVQGQSIEPDRERLLTALSFAGLNAPGREAPAGPETAPLPAGQYLFVQKREALGREDCLDLAIEQQKDGLWERLRPANRLYVRHLFEDGKPVTQLFRPYNETG